VGDGKDGVIWDECSLYTCMKCHNEIHYFVEVMHAHKKQLLQEVIYMKPKDIYPYLTSEEPFRLPDSPFLMTYLNV
jgi:hypothetical protein